MLDWQSFVTRRDLGHNSCFAAATRKPTSGLEGEGNHPDHQVPNPTTAAQEGREQEATRRSTRRRVRATQAGGYKGFERDSAHQAQLAKREARGHAEVLFVGPDEFGGRGLFARQDLEHKDLALYYRGELFNSITEHERQFPQGSIYALITKGGEVWDASTIMCLARFINHGTGPEANVQMCGINHTNIVELVLTRNLKRGEELRMDYGSWFDKSKLIKRLKIKGQDIWADQEDQEVEQWIQAMGVSTPPWAKEEAICTSKTIVESHTQPGTVTWSCSAKNPRSPAQQWSHTNEGTRPQKTRRRDGLEASDGLIYKNGDYVQDWSSIPQIVKQRYPSLVAIDEDLELDYNALARDDKDSVLSMPSQANDAPWIKNAAAAEWAWGSKIVYIGFVPNRGVMGQQQIFLDTLKFPKHIYHYRTRSGRAGLNRAIEGSFTVVEKDSEGRFLEDTNAPLLQIDRTHGVRLAGSVIKGVWESPHTFVWRSVADTVVHPRYANGSFTMDPEGHKGVGRAFSNAAKYTAARDSTKAFSTGLSAQERKWTIFRARVVGGPGAISLFSSKRKLAAPIKAPQLLPFPDGNREDYCVMNMSPPTSPLRVRARFANWSEVFRGNRYERIQKWIRRHTIHMLACEKYCEDRNVRSIPDADYEVLAAKHRLPNTLLMNDSDLIARCRGMRLFRWPNGTIEQRWDDDGPIQQSAVKPEAFAKERAENTPWANQRFFQDLFQGGLTPLAHEKKNSIILRPYPKTLYQCAAIWKEEREKGMDKDSLCTMFTPETDLELCSIPFILASRSHVPKADKVDAWRQILNMSLNIKDGARTVAPSFNARLKAARQLEHPMANLELTKGTDIATAMAIFRSHGLEPALFTWDASQWFHNFSVGFMQSCEQGIAGTKGLAVSTVYDMGRFDSPIQTGHASSFVAECVSKACHEQIMQAAKPLDPKAREMFRKRSEKFGATARQSRLAISFMYVDDIAVITLVGYKDLMEATMLAKTKPLGVVFTPDKYGAHTFIGQRYNIATKKGEEDSQHIKCTKIAKYIESWREMALLQTISDKVHDQLTGRLTYASTAYLELKPVAAIVYDCRNATSRFKAPGISPFSKLAREAMDFSINVIQKDEGLPWLPVYKAPKHFESTTITLRGDASLNEPAEEGETRAYNGWGIWIMVPQEHGPPKNLALFDEWSEREQELLGRNTPMAEALCLILGLRVCKSHKIALPFHRQNLQFTDSQSCSMKFASLRSGAVCLDEARAYWQELQDNNASVLPTTVEHCWREMNTGSDLLSKNRWELFKATLIAAGLEAPRRIFLSPKDRNIEDLISASRTF